ncbi:MAG TPA: phosphatidate cytidylyltransferase [Candidatus Babeliales bacterium]|nr:phosphatidate cytidylyltransferase [Candidatus Babeliales bacterium]
MHLLLSTEFLKRLITGIFLGIGFWGVYFYLPSFFFSLVLIIVLLLIIVYEWTRFFPINTSLFWLLMPPYLILPFALLIVLNHSSVYHELLLILFVLVFSFDTGSYITGTLIGKHYICESISPKKTWEGMVGGYIFAFLGFAFIIFERDYKASWWVIAVFTLIICLLSLAGDLFESWLKRRAGLKDSGTLLPGHGGFLDRFDGILFAVFFFYLCKNYLIKFLIK